MTTTSPSTTSATANTGLGSPTTQLKISSAATIGFGVMIAFGAHQRTGGLLRWFADLLFWPLGDPVLLTDEAQLLAAILGGVMVSWAVLFWLLTDALADDRPELLKRLILTTMAVWFVIDSGASIASGGWLNVIGNLAFLAMSALPARRL